MKLSKVALLGLLVLLIGLGGCGSDPNSSSTQGSSASITIGPESAIVGSPDVDLTIIGSNFSNARHNLSQAVWAVNNTDTLLATTFVSNTQLFAKVPAALLIDPATVQVFVQTGDPQGDVPPFKSNSVSFNVAPTPPGSPSISSISPPSATVGGPDLTLTLVGSGFTDANQQFNRVVWFANGHDTSLDTIFVNNNELSAVVPAALLRSPTTAEVHMEIWDDQGDVPDAISNLVAFNINLPGANTASGFTPTGSMSTARSGHTATLLMNGKLLVAGGGTATAELLDPSTLSFSPTGSMTTLRYGATATLLANGKVLIAGGFGSGPSQLPRLNSAELYDPLTGTFSATGSMSVGRVLHTAVLLNDSRVLIAGGTTTSGGGGAATASAEVYDPTTGLFTTVGSMVSDRAQHTATLLVNGRVLITGGWNGHAADAADDPPWDPLFAELFDPGSESFTASANMSTTRIGHVAIRLPNGGVLVLGGIPSLQNLHEQPINPAFAELYNPTVQTFSSIGSMQISQHAFTVTSLTNGKVLIAGGEQSGIVVGTAELLDPATGNLIATGGLIVARVGHTATLLADGSVLVAGGDDVNGNALASAERYK